MTAPNDLAALLGSRICHDLISPLGAIGNGLELLTLEGLTDRPELALIAEGVDIAQARIRFLRVAFGAASAQQEMGPPEVTGLLADGTRSTRLQVDWRVAEPVSRLAVRRALLAMMCLQSAMPVGGTIAISRHGSLWTAEAQGRRLRVEPDVWAILTDSPQQAALTSRHVHFGLLRADMPDPRGIERFDHTEDTLTLTWRNAAG